LNIKSFDLKNIEKITVNDHDHDACSGSAFLLSISFSQTAEHTESKQLLSKIHTVCIEMSGSIDEMQLKGWFASLFWERVDENAPVILRVKGMASVIDTNEKYIIQGMFICEFIYLIFLL
jgi:hypothetical protein